MSKNVATTDDLEQLDEMEAEIKAATETPTGKKEKTPKEPKAPKEPKIGENQVGASALAAELGITSRDLRMFLRKKFRNMDTEKGKTYVWDKNSKELQEIRDAYKAYKAAPRTKAEKIEKTAEATAPAESVKLDDIDLDSIE